jgi:hypothetical protein
MAATPRVEESAGWGYSLANLAELLFPCLEATGARSVLEIGAYKGDLTGVLLGWAAESGASIAAVDPEPPEELLELAEEHPELELLRKTSHEVLREVELPDVIIIDGDHNYFTLSEELRIISERAAGPGTPLMMFHDVGWPHARRDSYYVPDRIPEEHRQPLAHDVCLVPWDSGVVDEGLPFAWAAEREGGPRNGTLTALEDHVEAHPELRMAAVPAFFGFGVVWHEDAPWADAVAEILAPWDRNTLVERLEENRVNHLVIRHSLESQLEHAWAINTEKDKVLREHVQVLAERDRLIAKQRGVLSTLLHSRAFAIAERLSRLWQRGTPPVSREKIRSLLAERPSARDGASEGP